MCVVTTRTSSPLSLRCLMKFWNRFLYPHTYAKGDGSTNRQIRRGCLDHCLLYSASGRDGDGMVANDAGDAVAAGTAPGSATWLSLLARKPFPGLACLPVGFLQLGPAQLCFLRGTLLLAITTPADRRQGPGVAARRQVSCRLRGCPDFGLKPGAQGRRREEAAMSVRPAYPF